jgi:hypothetical protein
MLNMAAETTAAVAGAGSAGRGLGWNQAELLAVARAAPAVLQNPTIGANQNATELRRRLFTEFLRDECCPNVPECTRSDKSNLDSRRWHGRSALATLQCWTKRIKAPCVRLHAVCRRIQVAELTGGPYPNDSMHRLATAIFNSKDGESSQLFSHAYDIIRNEHYVIGPLLPVPSAYDLLTKKTNLLSDGMEELTPVVSDGAGGAAVDELASDGAAGGVKSISHKRPSSGGVKSTKQPSAPSTQKLKRAQTRSSTR